MAEKNQVKLTAFEQETIDAAKKVLEFKIASEANVVSILYKNPDEIYNTNLTIDDFSNNVWRVYFEIAHEIILTEKKNTLDDITVGIYLEKHPKLKAKYIYTDAMAARCFSPLERTSTALSFKWDSCNASMAASVRARISRADRP